MKTKAMSLVVLGLIVVISASARGAEPPKPAAAQPAIAPNSVFFLRDVMPLVTRLGCNSVTVPVVINGRIQKSGDEDYFIFKAEAGQKLLMEVDARRLDSPPDSVLALFDAAGKKLAANLDPLPTLATPNPANLNQTFADLVSQVDPRDALVTHVAHSRIVYTFAKAGDYPPAAGHHRESHRGKVALVVLSKETPKW